MRQFLRIYIGIVFGLLAVMAYGQQERNQAVVWSAKHGWEYVVKAGFNVGGTSPLP